MTEPRDTSPGTSPAAATSRSDRGRSSFATLAAIIRCPNALSVRMVGIYLWSRANKESGLSWPSIATICGDLHITRRTVQVALRELEQGGIITTETLTGRTREKIVARYGAGHVPAAYRMSQVPFVACGARLLAPQEAKVGREKSTPGAQKTTKVGRSRSRPNSTRELFRNSPRASEPENGKTTKEKTTPETHSPLSGNSSGTKHIATAEANAISIYTAYPRKVGRGKAIPAIRRALKKIEHTKLLAAVKVYAESVASKLGTDEERFIPHPATWFNGEHWLDEARVSAAPATVVDDVEWVN